MHVADRRGIRVEARADVLQIDDDRVDAGRASRRSAAASRRRANGSAGRSSRRATNRPRSSSSPRMPCSGLNSATSVTSGACGEQIDRARAVARPAGLVGQQTDALAAQPRELFATRARRCRSAPVAWRDGRGRSGRGVGAPSANRAALIARLARRARHRQPTAAPPPRPSRPVPRSGVTSPLPSGCTRFDRKIDVALRLADRATATCR